MWKFLSECMVFAGVGYEKETDKSINCLRHLSVISILCMFLMFFYVGILESEEVQNSVKSYRVY